jgi:hypothetical protein
MHGAGEIALADIMSLAEKTPFTPDQPVKMDTGMLEMLEGAQIRTISPYRFGNFRSAVEV